jgi:hypothetical protein
MSVGISNTRINVRNSMEEFSIFSSNIVTLKEQLDNKQKVTCYVKFISTL